MNSASIGIVGGLGPESTIDYYRRILAAWQQLDPSTMPSIVIDSFHVGHALRLVARPRGPRPPRGRGCASRP
jgi:aspartate racemase